MNENRALLIDLWRTGVRAVSGEQSVTKALLSDEPFEPDLIVALGKAASSMCLGALNALKHFNNSPNAIMVTKYHHTDAKLYHYPNLKIIESAHPVPDKNSLKAGKLIFNAISSLSEKSNLLLLISGGTSSLSEYLPSNISLEELQKITSNMLASGKTIAEINQKRKEISLIKGGKLVQAFLGSKVRVYAISDVQNDSIEVIASGTGSCKYAKRDASTRIIGSNKLARLAISHEAKNRGLKINFNEEILYDDVFTLAPKIVKQLKKASPGIYIFGGEPTIRLPKNPGEGGRNQSLALAIAKEISGLDNISVLVAGTDGIDGLSNAAGAIVNGDSFLKASYAKKALDDANASYYLRNINDIFITGATNTNVMDIAIAIVS